MAYKYYVITFTLGFPVIALSRRRGELSCEPVGTSAAVDRTRDKFHPRIDDDIDLFNVRYLV